MPKVEVAIVFRTVTICTYNNQGTDNLQRAYCMIEHSVFRHGHGHIVQRSVVKFVVVERARIVRITLVEEMKVRRLA